jgi:hypothetical protein
MFITGPVIGKNKIQPLFDVTKILLPLTGTRYKLLVLVVPVRKTTICRHLVHKLPFVAEDIQEFADKWQYL